MSERKQQRREALPGCDHQAWQSAEEAEGNSGGWQWASRLRRLMIQLAWRVVIFQPKYRGMQRWQSVLGLGVEKTSGAARKKAIVALARQLAVDLWRIATGRIKAEEVGLVLRPSV